MTLVMPASIPNQNTPGQHGQDVDEAKERKRLQNRIAQRKFRERKAQQQALANAAAANTAGLQGKAFQDIDLKGIPPEVLPWIGKLCPYTSLPIPPPPSSSHSATATPIKLEDSNTDSKRNGSKNLDCFQCNKCGRRLFSILGDACICTMPTPQTPSTTISNHRTRNSLGDHGGLTSPSDISTMMKSSPRDDDFPFDMPGFQTPATTMSMTQDILQPTSFIPERTNSMPLIMPSKHNEFQNFSMSHSAPAPGPARGIMSFFPDDNTCNSVSALVSQTLSCAQEINAPLLHVAVFNGHCKIVQMLVEHSFDINEQDQFGTTALHVAVRSRNENVVNLLLQHGANAYLKDQEGQSPLHLAVQIGFESAVGMFLAHSTVRSTPS